MISKKVRYELETQTPRKRRYVFVLRHVPCHTQCEPKTFVSVHGGADYLQIYDSPDGEKLYLIDQLSREMIETGQFAEEDNYCTLLFSWEY